MIKMLQGYQRLDGVMSPDIAAMGHNYLLGLKADGRMNLEDDGGLIYKESYGISNVPYFDKFYDDMTRLASQVTGLRLKKANSYARLYYSDITLGKHFDREGLDLTMTIQLSNETGGPCLLGLETFDRREVYQGLNNGDSILLKGRDLKHWRKAQSAGSGPLSCLFLHWTIVSTEIWEFPGVLSGPECDQLVFQMENMGFHDSTVLQEGKTNYDVHSRDSKTCFLPDNNKFLYTKVSEALAFRDLELEGFQGLKYDIGQTFPSHMDPLRNNNDRLFTILMYLNSNFEGGETIFNKTGIVVKPKAGTLLVWQNLRSYRPNELSMHEGAKITNGRKYVIVNWALAKFNQNGDRI